MAYNLDFNVDDVVDTGDIPDGEYAVKVKSAEVSPGTKTPGSDILKIYFEIISGKYNGGSIMQALTIKHPKEDTVRIARQQLRRIVVALGKRVVKTEADLIGGKLKITVKKDGQYYRVTRFDALTGSVSSTPETMNRPGVTTAAAASGGRFANRQRSTTPAQEAPGIQASEGEYLPAADDDIPF